MIRYTYKNTSDYKYSRYYSTVHTQNLLININLELTTLLHQRIDTPQKQILPGWLKTVQRTSTPADKDGPDVNDADGSK